MSIKKVGALLCALVLSACGGGGGSGDPTDLSSPPNLKGLFDAIDQEKQKSEFETTGEYEARISQFAASLVGFHATSKVNSSYNADAQELRIGGLPSTISEGTPDLLAAFYRGYTQLRATNVSELYEGESRTVNDRQVHYYKILQLSASDAERIKDGFRVDYTYAFSAEDVQNTEYRCISANFTNCSHNISASVATFRVYNTVTGLDY